MKIVMTTHNRTGPSYVDATLKSYFASDARDVLLNISVHEPDFGFLNELLPVGTKVRVLTPEEAAEKPKLAVRARVVHATRIALESTGPSECVLLQDDVVFAPDWWSRLQKTLEMVHGTERAKIALSLYSHLNAFPGCRPLAPQQYWGLQAMFFGTEAKKAAIECLKLQPADYNPRSPGWGVATREPGKEARRPGADVRIKDFAVAADDVRIKNMLIVRPELRLWCHFPSLVQHVGRSSSISSPWHESPTFGNHGLCGNPPRR